MKKNTKKTLAERYLQSTILIFMVITLTLFQINLASAFDFDNVKTYDNNLKEYKIKNAFGLGDNIATIKLNTPQNVEVGVGYQKVAEFTITNGENNYKIINSIELYNLKNGMKEIIRDVDYKYKTFIEVDNYKKVCNDKYSNGTIIKSKCVEVEDGKRQEEQWLDFKNNSLKEGEIITLGLFTNVQYGDYVEWIVNVYSNERLTEWATWTSVYNNPISPTLPDTGMFKYSGEIINLSEHSTYYILVSVTKHASCAATKAYIGTTLGGSEIATASFVGNVATFNQALNPSTNYSIGAGSDGVYFTYTYVDGTSKPTKTGNLTWVAGHDGNTLVPSRAYNFVSITMDENDLIYPPVETLNSPINNYNSTSQTITFNCSARDNFDLDNVTFYLNGIVNQINTTGLNNTNYIFTKTLSDGNYNWTCGACDNLNQCTNASVRYLNIDTILPIINISYPTETINYFKFGNNETLNVTITDAILDDCWYSYSGTNTSFNCSTGVLSTNHFNYTKNYNSLIVYANDTFGNLNSTTKNWTYLILENSRSYNNPTFETLDETLILNFSSNEGFTISNPKLFYNGTSYSITNITINGNNYLLTKNLNIPLNQNETGNATYNLFWQITINDGFSSTIVNTSTTNQTSEPIILTICDGTYNVLTLNFTTRNETIPLDYVGNWGFGGNFLFGSSSGDLLKNISIQNNSVVSDLNICIYPNRTFYVNADIDYSKGGFLKRSYYLRNAEINNNSQDISLWFTQEDESTTIIASVKNGFLQPQKEHIIKLMRYYPGYIQYFLVETSKTDDFGQASLKIVQNDVDYRIIIEDSSGEVIHTTNPMRIICTATPCVVEIITGDAETLLENTLITQGISNSFSYSNETGYLTFTYSDPSGLTSEMRLEVEQLKSYGNVLICNSSVEGAAGVIACLIEDDTGIYTTTVWRSASPENPFATFILDLSETWKNFGATGLFWGMIITTLMFIIGVTISPILAGILSMASIILFMFLGIVAMPYGLFIAIMIVLIIFIIKIKG
jgi:hypothetical protein